MPGPTLSTLILVWVVGFVTGYAVCLTYFDYLFKKAARDFEEFVQKSKIAALKPERKDD